MLVLQVAVLLGGILASVKAVPLLEQDNNATLFSRDIRGWLPPAGHPIEERFQPVTDFDTDGCYYTSAIDRDGNTNPGLSNVIGKGIADDCRNPDRLNSANVYSRMRCNNGWCAIMYEYYFEKDQIVWGSIGGGPANGHVHDWENVVVFMSDGAVRRVAPSCHGKYDGATNSPPLLDGRPKVVYHKDGGFTHCWRIAGPGDDDIENFTGEWHLGTLVGWNYWPVLDGWSLRDRVYQKWPTGIAPKFWDRDNTFATTLEAAAAGQVPGFNPWIDA